MRATGMFEVKLDPVEIGFAGIDGNRFGRMSIDKTFNGDLIGSSQGEMLNCITSVSGSAGYVAIEQVEGTLDGKKGNFVLQHFGTMTKGGERLILEVLADSAQGDLHGLSGTMQINIVDGQHYYEFDYQLN